jgi:hypothetical protein
MPAAEPGGLIEVKLANGALAQGQDRDPLHRRALAQ